MDRLFAPDPTQEVATTDPPGRRSDGRDLFRLFLALLALTVALRVPAFFVPVFNSDETFLATQANVIRQGGQLYEDATDRKPPLVPYIYAGTFAFFETTALWSARVVAMLAVAVTALLLAIEARRRYGRRAGWIAGVLFIFAMLMFAPQDGQAANFEVFMLPSMVAAMLFARRGKGLAAGVAVAAATMAKQTGAATLLPVLYLLARARGRRGVGSAAVGFTVPTALVALVVGPGQLLYWAVLGNGSYLGMNTVSAKVLGVFVLMTVVWTICNLPLLYKLPQAWRERSRPALDGDTDTDLWLWLLSGAISVAIGMRFFGHYYMQLAPPLSLLAAGALVRSPWRTTRRILVAGSVLAALFSFAGYWLHPAAQPKYQSVSRFLSADAHPNDRILVWGSEPEIYWASGKLPATRFLSIGTFLTGNHPGRPADVTDDTDSTAQAWTYFYEDFTAHPPRYVIDTSPAHVRGAQHYPITRFPAFAAIVVEQYRFLRSIDGVDIWVRR